MKQNINTKKRIVLKNKSINKKEAQKKCSCFLPFSHTKGNINRVLAKKGSRKAIPEGYIALRRRE
ncbi:hypothetical protein MPR_2743 [Myroides profundi]|nr:hypothetical protein MPR_2743 [Myroides profundi]